MKQKQRYPQVYIIFLIVPIILFGGALFSGHSFFWGTSSLQFIPWRHLAVEILQAKTFEGASLLDRIPLWNPFNGMGAPLLANYQSALLYPPTWVTLIAGLLGGVEWLAWSHILIVILHVAWAGLGMAMLMKSLGTKLPSQLVSGLAFSLSLYFIGRISFFSMVWAGAWFPWIVKESIEFWRSDAKSDHSSHWWRWNTRWIFYVGMLLLAGHAQLAWYTILFASAWVIWGSVDQLGRKSAWRGWLRYGIHGAIAAGLAMVQLLPTAEYLLQSQRSNAVDFEMGLTYSFWPWRFLGFIAPDLFGNPGTGNYWGYGNYWEDAVYIGLLPFLLAVSTLGQVWKQKNHQPSRRGMIRFLWVIVFLASLFALGKNTPIFPFLYRYVPTFDMFNAPTRFMFLTVGALAMLAGIGLEQWKTPTGRLLYWTRLGTAGAFAITLGALVGMILFPDVEVTFIRAIGITGLLALGCGILSLTLKDSAVNWQAQKIWVGCLLVFIMIDLLFAGWKLNPAIDSDFYAPVDSRFYADRRSFMPPEDEYAIKFQHYFRFDSYLIEEKWDDLRVAALPNLNLLDFRSSANNFDPFVPARYAAWLEMMPDKETEAFTHWLQLMHVDELQQYVEAQQGNVARNLVVGGERVRWYGCAEYVNSPEAAYELVQNQLLVSPEKTRLIIEADKLSLQGDCGDNGLVDLIVLGETSTRMILGLQAGEHSGWVMIADTYYPGWQVRVDGKRADLLQVNYLFRGVMVPPGTERIELVYRPASFIIGTAVSSVVLIGLALGFLRRRKNTIGIG